MFRNTRHIHLVAIGGIGVSGIAEILLNLGFKVSGSDLRSSPLTERLAEQGARIHIGHAAEQIAGADVVVYSSAVTEANPELAAARAQRIPVVRRADMLAELMRLKYGIVVAGSHGKTTTTSLVGAVLAAGGLDPTIIVGGQALTTGRNAVLGGGEYLVAEADESDGSFLRLTPTVAVVTNIDHEHVDYYPEFDDLRAAFATFLERVPFYGTAVLCTDDPEVRALVPRIDRQVITYGLSEGADVRALELDPVAAGEEALARQRLMLLVGGEERGILELALPGRHNLCNALAAIAVGLDLGVTLEEIARGIGDFAGVGRRCEHHGVHGGVLVLDDYGHHPTEVLATLEVARRQGRAVAVVFQPHRFSRTERFAREFGDALAGADRVGLLPVYAAGEEARPGVGSQLIADALAEKGTTVDLIAGADALPAWLDERVGSGDLLLTLGAGDIGRRVAEICRHLDERADA